MYDIITKEDYFGWLDQGFVDKRNPSLKNIQDAFVLSVLSKAMGQRIAEVGGGQSRVLEHLAKNNECWNIDKLEGLGAGPREYKTSADVRLVRAYLGDFHSELPDGYFDYVFSISVLEHVPNGQLFPCFRDMARIIKPGGLCVHAIDVYLGDEMAPLHNPRINLYHQASLDPKTGLKLIKPPVINADTTFRCHYASNSDIILYSWNKIVPGPIVTTRTNCQNVSIKAFWKKSRSKDIH